MALLHIDVVAHWRLTAQAHAGGDDIAAYFLLEVEMA
jgi:hypothetical protein